MEIEKFDVAIVGAGIAGSTLAALLAAQNISVLVLEKASYAGERKACGGLFDKSYYDKVMPDDGVIEQHIKKNVFVLPWGRVTIPCDQVTVKRRKFDKKLAEIAQEKGAKLRYKSRVLTYKLISSGMVRLEIKDFLNKINYSVEGKLIVFADGPFSLARQNTLFASDQNKSFWAYAYAYEVEGVPIDKESIEIYLDKRLFAWGYGWIFPNSSESNIGVGTLLKFNDRTEVIKKQLFYFINHFNPTAHLLAQKKIVDRKGGFIPMKLLNNFVDNSQVVIGDAAGMVSPLFGAGIDYSIEAAYQCAPVLVEAILENDYSKSKLKKYEKNIDKKIVHELRKQFLIARIIIFSRAVLKDLPIKLFSVIAFGSKYTRWNKIKILFFPLLGKPLIKSV